MLTCGLPLGLDLFVFVLFIIAIFTWLLIFQFSFSQSATIGSGLPPPVGVERGFRVQWRLVRHFSASRKITSLHPKTEVLLLPPSLTVFDGVHSHLAALCSGVGITALHPFPMLKIIGIEFDVVANDVLQQSRHTHSVLTDFAGELIEHLA